MLLCDSDLAESGISQKWHKLRRRCASFKAMSTGPSSLDSDASFILTGDEPLSTTPILMPRQAPVNIMSRMDSNRAGTRDKHSWSNNSDKYEYRTVNLNGSVCEKMDKRFKSHDDDCWRRSTDSTGGGLAGSEWQRTRRSSSHHNSSKDLDWEYNVQKYENLVDRGDRLQYYDDSAKIGDIKKNSTLSDKKEVRFPSFKSFKSASMRLPGQKTSIQEVQQLLRIKFNRINIGLRKRRALSVQEVFEQHASSQQSSEQNTQTTVVPSKSSSSQRTLPPSQFYVPSPLCHKNNNNNDVEYINDEDSGPASLPYFVNESIKQIPTKGKVYSNVDARNNKNRVTVSRSAASNQNGNTSSNSGTKKLLPRSHSGNNSTCSNTTSINNTNDLGRNRSGETALSSAMPSSSMKDTLEAISNNDQDSFLTTSSSTIKHSQYVVGGVERVKNEENPQLHVSRSHNNNNDTIMNEKVRLRPRSHSPLKTPDDDKMKTRKKRESFGFFERLNRIMNNTPNLPPPHTNPSSYRANNHKVINKINTGTHNCKLHHLGGDGDSNANKRASATPNGSTISSTNKNIKNLTITTSRTAPAVTIAELNRTKKQPDILLLRDRKLNTQQSTERIQDKSISTIQNDQDANNEEESKFCTLPRSCNRFTIRQARFTKGPGTKVLGFSIVGGIDSPKGSMGIYVKTVYAHGQAAEKGTIKEGDEILSVNGTAFQGLRHNEAIQLFKSIKTGEMHILLGRRLPKPSSTPIIEVTTK